MSVVPIPATARSVMRALEDGAVRLADHVRRATPSPVSNSCLDASRARARGDLAAAVSAHAVGDREQRRHHQVGVLVALADVADVGRDARLDPHRRSSSAVLPILITSPGCTWPARRAAGRSVACRSSSPRSSTYQAPFFAEQARVLLRRVRVVEATARTPRRGRSHAGAELHRSAACAVGRVHDEAVGACRRRRTVRRPCRLPALRGLRRGSRRGRGRPSARRAR